MMNRNVSLSTMRSILSKAILSFTQQLPLAALVAIAIPVVTFLYPLTCAQSIAAQKQKLTPSSTLLIPISPKIDTSYPLANSKPGQQANKTTPAATTSIQESLNTNSESSAKTTQIQDKNVDQPVAKSIVDPLDESSSGLQANSDIGDDTTLKGTIQLVADDTEYDQEKNTFLGTGNAVVIIGGENSKLEADTVLYDQNNQIIDARGNVRILRDGQLTTGSAFRFNVTSDEYLITNPDTEVQGSCVIARKAVGSKTGIAFQNGTVELPEPLHIFSNALYGPLSASEEIMDKTAHPDAYLPNKPSFKFKARKITYERYKESGNLTVFGGRMMFGNFGVPIPKFSASVGQQNSRVIFPVTPTLGNTLNMGGISIGPSINRPVGKNAVFSVTPLLQIGGRSLSTSNSNSGKLGAGAKLAYTGEKISAHLAYGSVSNLVVGDFKWLVSPKVTLQSGINRFVNDGLFGYNRPRFITEVVHSTGMGTIPFLAYLNFRTSAGAAQDNSSLLNLTPTYAKLFDQPTKPEKTFALRVQEQITASTHPIFSLGDDKVGAKMFVYGGVGLKGYSTGDTLALAQAGPILNVYLNRLRLQGGYTQSAVRGKSPFVFDQFIQGQRSVSLGGDVKVSKYLTLGAYQAYNINAKLTYARAITAAVGPDDLKCIFSYDTIRKNNRYGFDLLFGQPIPFNKLVLKGSPDQGQLGGI